MIKRKRGYTLVEMIVVIAVIGILISLTFYGIRSARRNSRTSKAKSDMTSLGYSVVAYHDANKDNYDLNDQWPRDMYQTGSAGKTALVNQVPWELNEKGFWSKSEPINSGLAYERFPCSPRYGENFNIDTQELSGSVAVDFSNNTAIDGANRQNACSLSTEVAYVGINWAGIDGDFGLNNTNYGDNGFLLIDVEKPIPTTTGGPADKNINTDSVEFKGTFLFKMGGSDEDCDEPASACTF